MASSKILIYSLLLLNPVKVPSSELSLNSGSWLALEKVSYKMAKLRHLMRCWKECGLLYLIPHPYCEYSWNKLFSDTSIKEASVSEDALHLPALITQLLCDPLLLWPGTWQPSLSFSFKNYIGSCGLNAFSNFLLWLCLPQSLYFFLSCLGVFAWSFSNPLCNMPDLETPLQAPKSSVSPLVRMGSSRETNPLKPMCFIHGDPCSFTEKI